MSRRHAMSRRHVSIKQRRLVRKLLKEYYEICHRTSGVVKVTSVRFSADPRKWTISAEVERGTAYGLDLDFRRSNVIVSAVLSYDWLDQPDRYRPHEDVERNERSIIAGIAELPAPEGIDRMELLIASAARHGGVALTTQPFFRYTLGEHLLVLRPTTPCTKWAGINTAIETTTATVRAMIAQRVAERMNPKPKKPSNINEWANFVAQHKSITDAITKATNDTADALHYAAQSFKIFKP